MTVAVLGIDIGGSKTHGVRAELDGDAAATVVADATVGSASLSSVGAGEAARQLDVLLSRLGPGGVQAVCVGAAGVDTPEAEARLEMLVRERIPAVPVRVVHDTHLVLAAAGLDTGAVGISGTGSAAWGRNSKDQQTRASGWGYLLGDDGSAYGVVRAALRHVLDRADNDEDPDLLTSALTQSCAVETTSELLDLFYKTPSRREWAAKASLVFALAERGDPACLDIVDGAAAELVRAVTRVCRKLGLTGPVVLAGGVAVHQPLLQDAVTAGLRSAGIDDVQVLRCDPVHGAVELARALFEGHDGSLARSLR